MDSAFCFTTAKNFKISYTFFNCNSLGRLAVEASFIFGLMLSEDNGCQ